MRTRSSGSPGFLVVLLFLFLVIKSSPSILESEESIKSAESVEQNIGQLMMNKVLTRIMHEAKNRAAIKADKTYTVKKYNTHGSVKSEKSETKTVQGRPKLEGVSLDIYQILGSKYDFYIDPQESVATVNGTECAVVKFRPKAGLRKGGVADEFINRLEGTVYINIEEYYMVKIEGKVPQPFQFTYNLLYVIPIGVDVYRLDFSAEYQLFNGIVVERYFRGFVDYEVKNRGAEEHIHALTNYR
ncbi:MAG: hypothetical protein UW79_C0004G0028 [Candidatus Yanofskybacteria bacterium GW2011_GWA2_44_9]|uniref:Uncharacterized protein n=1 Tax=Candidatus Yanofskybacteria bacterium GW2011_GWA2_44_9 TaxID=1619025 RepID=A0A0G1KFN7_9BACT|nr:MAG: hypothetical protein UW79_C0004G0028 [Candidatus Yanofskybacteria bacterium GW2011_GWA2_44_9]